MKSNVEKMNGLQHKLNIVVPAPVVQSAFQKVFSGIQKEVTIKGFRKGKAPIATIKSVYGDRVAQDVVNDLIQQHYPKAVSEHKLDPISYPDFEFDQPNEEKDFSFSAFFDIRPEVTLKKYENLEVEKEKLTFDESKINDVVENIRASRARFEDIAILRPVQKGDVAVVDFEGFVDGAPLENGKGENHHLEIGAKQFIEGFEEGVEGMNVNDVRTLNLKFPNPYHAAELAGKAVEFKVTLKSIKSKVLPEVDAEFLKSVGAPESMEEFRKTIREDLEGTEKKRIEDAFKNRLLKKLVEANPVDVPSSLLKDQKKSLVADFENRMKQQGMSEADFKTYVEKWDGDFEKTASQMIQASFLIDAIARKHDLNCTREDLDQKLKEYAAQTGIEETRIREFYSKPEQTSRLTYMITEDKVVQHLLKTIKIKEVDGSLLKDEETL